MKKRCGLVAAMNADPRLRCVGQCRASANGAPMKNSWSQSCRTQRFVKVLWLLQAGTSMNAQDKTSQIWWCQSTTALGPSESSPTLLFNTSHSRREAEDCKQPSSLKEACRDTHKYSIPSIQNEPGLACHWGREQSLQILMNDKLPKTTFVLMLFLTQLSNLTGVKHLGLSLIVLKMVLLTHFMLHGSYMPPNSH